MNYDFLSAAIYVPVVVFRIPGSSCCDHVVQVLVLKQYERFSSCHKFRVIIHDYKIII